MLSIIISTINQQYQKAVVNNIRLTAGIPIEIITIDNSDGSRGLCEIYNEGTQRAQFRFLCFMHEDVHIRTIGWGKKIIDYFESHESLGLLGLVGSTYKSSILSGWSPYGHIPTTVNYGTIIQHHKYSDKPINYYYQNPFDEILTEVAVVDGVWLCTTKEIINKFPFDQNTFKRFHGYDIDISLSIGTKYKIGVVYDIIIEHYSEGLFEREWASETIKLQKKWKASLPLNKAGFNEKQIIHSEKTAFESILPNLITWGYPLKDIVGVLKYSCLRKYAFLYIKLYISIIYKYIKSKKIERQTLINLPVKTLKKKN